MTRSTIAPLVIVCLVIVSGQAFGQGNDELRDFDLTRDTPSTARCQDPACQRLQREIATAAGETSGARAAFVIALRRLVEDLPGTYGDEGPRIREAADAMAAALARWDEAIAKYRAALTAARGADAHAALGSTYLDRGRLADAGAQLRQAVELAPAWSEASLLLGMAYQALGAHGGRRAGVDESRPRVSRQSRDRICESAARDRQRR